MLHCSNLPGDPLSYVCNWMAPTETNGALVGYQLTCEPQSDGIPTPPAVTSSTTSANISDLRNGVNYSCTVRARNEAGISLASGSASVYTVVIGMLRHVHLYGWLDPSYWTALVPGPPVCPGRWSLKSLSSLTINWQPPTQPNGVITGYFLELVSFDNGTVLQSATVLNTSSYTFTGFTIGMIAMIIVIFYCQFSFQLLEFPIMLECMQRTQMAEEVIVSLQTLVTS